MLSRRRGEYRCLVRVRIYCCAARCDCRPRAGGEGGMSNSSQTIPARATLIDLYRRMALIKLNDERFRAVIKSGKIVAPYYSPRGQEVIPAAISVNLTDEDYICTIYRGIHDMLAKGVPMRELWAEIAGKPT